MHAAPALDPAPGPRVVLTRIPAPILAALALLAAATLWGTSFVAAKFVLADLPPVAVALLRFAIAAAVLVPLACRGGARPALGIQPALLGLTGVTLFFLCQNAGLRQTSATHATLILGGGLPVLTALLGAGCLGERPTHRQLLGLACALAGVIAVAAAGGGIDSSSLRGDGLLLLAAAAGAVFTVLGRRAFAGPDPLAVVASSMLWGAIFLVPPAAFEATVTGVVRPSLSGLLLLLYLGIGCSALAFALCAYGLRHLSAAQSAIMGTLELPVGLTAAALLLGEVLGPSHLAGAILLLTGALFAVDRSSPTSEVRQHDSVGTVDRDLTVPPISDFASSSSPVRSTPGEPTSESTGVRGAPARTESVSRHATSAVIGGWQRAAPRVPRAFARVQTQITRDHATA